MCIRNSNRTFRERTSNYRITSDHFHRCVYHEETGVRLDPRIYSTRHSEAISAFLPTWYRSQICTLLLPSVASFFFLSFFSPLNTALRRARACVSVCTRICVHSPTCTARILGGQLLEKRIEKREETPPSGLVRCIPRFRYETGW